MLMHFSSIVKLIKKARPNPNFRGRDFFGGGGRLGFFPILNTFFTRRRSREHCSLIALRIGTNQITAYPHKKLLASIRDFAANVVNTHVPCGQACIYACIYVGT
jgi:hypothetical protein